MKKETTRWLEFAEDNLKSAQTLLEHELFNPSLQNSQQAVEKSLKALCLEQSITFRKTHNILELKNNLESKGARLNLNDDDCDLLDSIYLPSKYPFGSALPDFEPNRAIC